MELLEERLKHDVLQELARYHAVLVTQELNDGQLVDVWVEVAPGAVKTPREIYDQLAAENYNVRYLRVPITHTRAPKGRDFDILASAINGAPSSCAHIFNCQAGHGRTTTAMVVACLCLRSIANQSTTGLRQSVTDAWQGEWVVVSRLLRLLQGGQDAKNELDSVIDECSAVVNLRDGMQPDSEDTGRSSPTAKQLSHDKVNRDFLAHRVKHLDLYCCLITFAAWVRLGMPARSYKVWRKMRPEVHDLRAFIRRNPMAALEFSKAVQVQEFYSSCLDAGLAATHRHGAVLGPTTMLKRHFLAGPARNELEADPESIDCSDDDAPPQTVPRLCCAKFDVPVACFATSSVSGLRNWLQDDMEAGPGGTGPCVFLTDLREELVVYINDEPFTLREGHRPIQSIKMASLSGQTVEELETRLKTDVLAEAQACGGRILVHREPRYGSLQDGLGQPDDTAPSVQPYWCVAQKARSRQCLILVVALAG